MCGQEMIGKEAASGFLGIDVWKRVFRPITKEKFVTDGAFFTIQYGLSSDIRVLQRFTYFRVVVSFVSILRVYRDKYWSRTWLLLIDYSIFMSGLDNNE